MLGVWVVTMVSINSRKWQKILGSDWSTIWKYFIFKKLGNLVGSLHSLTGQTMAVVSAVCVCVWRQSFVDVVVWLSCICIFSFVWLSLCLDVCHCVPFVLLFCGLHLHCEFCSREYGQARANFCLFDLLLDIFLFFLFPHFFLYFFLSLSLISLTLLSLLLFLFCCCFVVIRAVCECVCHVCIHARVIVLFCVCFYFSFGVYYYFFLTFHSIVFCFL